MILRPKLKKKSDKLNKSKTNNQILILYFKQKKSNFTSNFWCQIQFLSKGLDVANPARIYCDRVCARGFFFFKAKLQ